MTYIEWHILKKMRGYQIENSFQNHSNCDRCDSDFYNYLSTKNCSFIGKLNEKNKGETNNEKN